MRFLRSIKIVRVLIFVFIVLYVSILLQSIPRPYGEQHFSFLSYSFLNGRLDLNDFPWVWDDTALYLENYYWPLGLFPAILHLPFTYISNIFGYMVYQRHIQWIFVLLTFLLIYKISKKNGYPDEISILWSSAFCIGSVFVYVSLVPFSWYFAQVITTLLIFTALFEYFGKRRYFIIGILYAAIFLSRATALLGIVFYLLSILFVENKNFRSRFNDVLRLGLPVILGFFISGVYNFLRFGSALEQGYSYQLLGEELVKARSYGMFSLIHIPGNLYYLFLAAPLPVLKDEISRVLTYPFIRYDLWGMGIFFTSTYFLNLFILPYKEKISKILLLTSVIVAIPILLYYGIGANQYGYRYSLDFLPYLFLILMIEHKNSKMSLGFKTLLLLTIVFNTYFILN